MGGEPADYNKSTSWIANHDFSSAKRSYADHRRKSQEESYRNEDTEIDIL